MLSTWTSQTAILLALRAGVRLLGNVRQQEYFGVLRRAHYAYGLRRAAEMARHLGQRRVTACEFGVAAGAGLLNMITLAERIGPAFGVTFRIVGFDSGQGLFTVQGHKDHPELWSPGDFPMVDRDALLRSINGRGELLFGDISDTVVGFTRALGPEAPLGFAAVDVDLYSSTVAALKVLEGPPEGYLTGISMYFDDTEFFTANRWCGELAAIEEFNAGHELRKIDQDRSLPGDRPVRDVPWYRQMYVAHILDHPARVRPSRSQPLTLESHKAHMREQSLY